MYIYIRFMLVYIYYLYFRSYKFICTLQLCTNQSQNIYVIVTKKVSIN